MKITVTVKKEFVFKDNLAITSLVLKVMTL